MLSRRTIRLALSCVLVAIVPALAVSVASATTVCPCPRVIEPAIGDADYMLDEDSVSSTQFPAGRIVAGGDVLKSMADGRFIVAERGRVSRFLPDGSPDVSFGSTGSVAIDLPVDECGHISGVTDAAVGVDGSAWIVHSGSIASSSGGRVIGGFPTYIVHRIDPTGAVTRVSLGGDSCIGQGAAVEVEAGAAGDWYLFAHGVTTRRSADASVLATASAPVTRHLIGVQPAGDLIVRDGTRVLRLAPDLGIRQDWGDRAQALWTLPDGGLLLTTSRDGGSLVERLDSNGDAMSIGYGSSMVSCWGDGRTPSPIDVAAHDTFVNVLHADGSKFRITKWSFAIRANPASPVATLATRRFVSSGARQQSPDRAVVIGRLGLVEPGATGCDGPGIERVTSSWKGRSYSVRSLDARRLTAGAGTMTVRAYDRLGAVTTTRFDLLVDHRAPVVSTTVDRTGMLRFAVRDPQVGRLVQSGSVAHAAVRVPARGCRIAVFNVSDRAGNVTLVRVEARSGVVADVSRSTADERPDPERGWQPCPR